jgi:hypothetical protein
MSKHIKHFLPLLWSGMGFTLTCMVMFIPMESDRTTLAANTISGLLGAAFGAAIPNKEETENP